MFFYIFVLVYLLKDLHIMNYDFDCLLINEKLLPLSK